MLKHYKYVYQKLNSIQPELAHMFYYDEHIDKMEASAPPEEFIIDSSIPSEAQGDYCLMSFLVSSVSYDLPDDVSFNTLTAQFKQEAEMASCFFVLVNQ